MVTIEAPVLSPRIKIALPDPTFTDSEGLLNEVDIKQAIDGTVYSYVKAKDGRRRLQYPFTTTRMKAQEVFDFAQVYLAEHLKIVDHLGVTWHGYLAVNPIDEETLSVHGSNGPESEMMQFTLEFEAIKQ